MLRIDLSFHSKTNPPEWRMCSSYYSLCMEIGNAWHGTGDDSAKNIKHKKHWETIASYLSTWCTPLLYYYVYKVLPLQVPHVSGPPNDFIVPKGVCESEYYFQIHCIFVTANDAKIHDYNIYIFYKGSTSTSTMNVKRSLFSKKYYSAFVCTPIVSVNLFVSAHNPQCMNIILYLHLPNKIIFRHRKRRTVWIRSNIPLCPTNI